MSAGAEENGDKADTAAKEERAEKDESATAEDTSAAAPPSPKRQATEARKDGLDAEAPLGAGPKPKNVLEEGRIYFIYR